jgi:hypothetical protein
MRMVWICRCLSYAPSTGFFTTVSFLSPVASYCQPCNGASRLACCRYSSGFCYHRVPLLCRWNLPAAVVLAVAVAAVAPPPLGEGLQLCVRSATRLSPLPLFIAIDMTPAVSNIAL